MSKRILLSAPYMLPSLERFRPVFQKYSVELIVPEVNERLEVDEIMPFAGDFDGALCGDDRFTAEVIEACSPRLKVISKWGTGIDSIDQDAAKTFGVQVRNTPDAFTEPVSDSVMAYILSFARQSPWLDDSVKAGNWEKLPGHSLAESSLGIVGVGRIGKAVARRARAFGMQVMGNDPVDMPKEFLLKTDIEMLDLENLLADADYVSLNCDLNPSSRHIINAQSLALMKTSAIVINTARGPLLDEAALVKALKAGKLAGAALDVFEDEPLPKNSPLREMENVLLAPHNANASPAAWERVHWNTIRNLFEGLRIEHDNLDPQDYPVLT